MKAFQYATAHSTDSARQLVADKGAYLAGGNDLLGGLIAAGLDCFQSSADSKPLSRGRLSLHDAIGQQQ